MKSTTLLALFLLSAFTSYLPSATADLVLDTDGDPLQNGGGMYHVLPVLRGWGGGIEPAITGNETCPLTVVQSPFEVSRGFPTMFQSRLRIPFVGEGHLLTIRFSVVPWCAPTPSQWTIVEGQPEGHAVKLTGYANTVVGEFKIEKAPNFNFYKLSFCALNASTCGDIGNQKGLLVVTENNPLWVQFQKFRPFRRAAPLVLKNHVLSRSER
ncbi:Kunitz-type trypsin inhibitor KTI1 [Spatholobus suberectus]|nr:Kunitz-type trypsin inhibitor KTI1 [Spatholobus suberectus]